MGRKSALLLTAGCAWLGVAAACSAQAAVGAASTAHVTTITVAPGEDSYLNADSVSRSAWCGSPADCTLIFADGRTQVMAASEVHGTWHAPVAIPGLLGIYYSVRISCASPGNCLAGTSARPGPLPAARVAREVSGRWDAATGVPGAASLSSGGPSQVTALSCGASGWCAVAGAYGPAGTTHSGPFTPFLATLHGGTWVKAALVPGLAALTEAGHTATISAVSCDPDGSCAAGGSYYDQSAGRQVPFVVTGQDGTWGQATPISGEANKGFTTTSLTSVACTTAGNCSAAGTAVTGTEATWPFLVTERNGTWGKARAIPGIHPGRTFTAAAVTSLACTAPGDCVLAGYRGDSTGDCDLPDIFCYNEYVATIPFTAEQAGGTWRDASEFADLTAGNRGGITLISSVSCTSAGHCLAGAITTRIKFTAPIRGFVIAASGGAWGQPQPVPGLPAPRGIGSEIDFTFCGAGQAAAPRCIAIGGYLTTGPGGRDQRHLFASTG